MRSRRMRRANAGIQRRSRPARCGVIQTEMPDASARSVIQPGRRVATTGSSPAVPPIPGLENVPYLTNESIFDLTARPEHLVVIGAGPIGLELAQAFLREFDARVDLYADNARQREDFEQQIKATSAEDNRRLAPLGAENQRLKKSLAEAERKLSAVAEMERSLLENGAEPAPDGTVPPQ